MRNMSFALTTAQILAQTKTVTRRVGWTFLKPGDLIQPVKKSQGIKKGEQVEKLGGPIRVLDARREPLAAITEPDVVAEGFPAMTPAEFVEMFCATHTVPDRRIGPPRNRYRQPFPMLPCDEVTRIEFAYTDQPDAEVAEADAT